jgi:hypothetical protein
LQPQPPPWDRLVRRGWLKAVAPVERAALEVVVLISFCSLGGVLLGCAIIRKRVNVLTRLLQRLRLTNINNYERD